MPRLCELARSVAASGQSTGPSADDLVASEEGFQVEHSYVQAKMMGWVSITLAGC